MISARNERRPKKQFFIIETVCDLCEEWAEAKETIFIIETNCGLCEV